MGRVAVTLNNRSYRLNCGDGEEHRIAALADHVRQKMEAVISEFGQVGEERLLLMAALLVTDELFDLRDQIADAKAAGVDEAEYPATVRSAIAPPEAARQAEVAPIASSSVPVSTVDQADASGVEETPAQPTLQPEPAQREPAVELNARSSRFAKQALSSRKPLSTS